METVYVQFSGDINFESIKDFRNLCTNAIIENPNKSLTILFSSLGGSPQAAFTLYEFLRSLKIPITICNVGSVESSAIIVFLGVDSRVALSGTYFKLHGLHWTFNNNVADYWRVIEAGKSLDIDIKRYCDIFKERTHGAERRINILECLRGKTVIISDDAAGAFAITTAPVAGIAMPGMGTSYRN